MPSFLIVNGEMLNMLRLAQEIHESFDQGIHERLDICSAGSGYNLCDVVNNCIESFLAQFGLPKSDGGLYEVAAFRQLRWFAFATIQITSFGHKNKSEQIFKE